MSAWNDFVKKIYWENKKKNKDYQFKDALKEASRRKGEMGTKSNKMATKSNKMATKSNKMATKSKKCCKCPKKRKTRKRGFF